MISLRPRALIMSHTAIFTRPMALAALALSFSGTANDLTAQTREAPSRHSGCPRSGQDCMEITIANEDGSSRAVEGTRQEVREELLSFIMRTNRGPVDRNQALREIDAALDAASQSDPNSRDPQVGHQIMLTYTLKF